MSGTISYITLERLLGDVSSYKSCHQLKRKGKNNVAQVQPM